MRRRRRKGRPSEVDWRTRSGSGRRHRCHRRTISDSLMSSAHHRMSRASTRRARGHVVLSLLTVLAAGLSWSPDPPLDFHHLLFYAHSSLFSSAYTFAWASSFADLPPLACFGPSSGPPLHATTFEDLVLVYQFLSEPSGAWSSNLSKLLQVLSYG